MTISEKVSYLKGLAEGLELDESSKEGKMLLAILEVLTDIAMEVTEMQFDLDVFNDELDSVDEELDLLFQEEFNEEEDYEDYDGDVYYVFCSHCQEEILLDEEMLDKGEIICPTCSASLEFDFQQITRDEIDSDIQ